jgi:hypothetical protein
MEWEWCEGRERQGWGFYSRMEERGGGHGQWLSGRAVASTNGGAGGDVGAVQGSDVAWRTSAEAREERGSSGRGFQNCCSSSFPPLARVSVAGWVGWAWPAIGLG